jgi:TRAP-type C4-dicarboxylate transport system permease large subunit
VQAAGDGLAQALGGAGHEGNVMPARLAVVSVVGGTVFSAISGSSVATTALLGSTLLLEMLKRNYHPRLATGPIMAIGAVDMLIPPSAMTVLLGSLGQISIAGLLLAAIFVAYIIVRVKISPSWAPASTGDAHDGGVEADLRGWDRWRDLLLHVAPLLAIFLFVILSMTLGWATPTESTAVGASACLLICLLHCSVTFKNLGQAAEQHGGTDGHDSVHHRRRVHLRADPGLLGGDRRPDQRHP